MDPFQLLEEAGKVPPAQNATIDATVELVLTAASQEGSQSAPAASLARRRTRRHRRIAFGAIASAAAAALAAAAFLTVTALLPASHPGGHQPSHPAHAQLAAWTVVKQADGTVNVKIREFRDPAGLQAALRADGVPASVILVRSLPPNANGNLIPGDPCHGGPWSQSVQDKVVTGNPFGAGMFIHLSALPSNAGIQFVATTNVRSYSPQHPGGAFAGYWLVQASPQCTGS
jgi:hypothetical protein